jgi:uncharacterized protein YndB with AHSA1/START domain
MTTVYRSRRIAAPAAEVWAYVRDFGAIERWLPVAPGPAELTGDPAALGAERTFRRNGEIVAVERLVTLDERARVTGYTIVRAPAPLRDHLATLTVSDDDGGALVEWEATFSADPQAADAIAEAMATRTFEPGLARLAELCEQAVTA